MSYLLDTNVVSELRKPRHRAAPAVVSWASAVLPSELHLSVVTVLEVERGIAVVERRDPAQGALLRRWLERSLLVAFDGRVLPVDTAVARRAATLHVPDPRPERDALIAATALVHGLTIVTRTVRDFSPMGLSDLLDPWA